MIVSVGSFETAGGYGMVWLKLLLTLTIEWHVNLQCFLTVNPVIIPILKLSYTQDFITQLFLRLIVPPVPNDNEM